MNKSESKYYNTAARMDEAFLELLSKKDFAYITVKEICEKAGVNRSTFYLHYETVADLLSESVEYMNRQFLNYFHEKSKTITARLHDCSDAELILITPEYLTPYLSYIKENRRLFSAAIKNAATLRLNEIYDRLFISVFSPVLERFKVPEQDRRYIMSYYICGLMAIITEWIKQDCSDSIEHVIGIIETCVIQA